MPSPNDKRSKFEGNEALTPSDLNYIIEVNKKAIEINIENVQQQAEIIEHLEELKDLTKELVEDQREDARLSQETHKLIKDELQKEVKDIEKNLFRLVIILGSAGIGTILAILQSVFHK